MEEKCTNCNKKITREEYIENGGYCNQCIDEKEQEEEKEDEGNFTANLIGTIAIISGVIGVIFGIMCIGENAEIGVGIIIASIISAIFIYGFSEIIQLLEDIKNK